MHPAFSVVLFTTSHGAGYGMLALLGVLGPLGFVPIDPWFGLGAFVLSLGAATLGLMASTFHLGHPERAWRAYTQWRSSWLSREGVLATITYLPAILFGFGWIVLGDVSGIWGAFGLASAALAIVTVFATSMIYRSLETIHAWANDWVPPIYVANAILSGAIWFNMMLLIFDKPWPGFAWFTSVAIAVGWGLKICYWHFIDTTRHPSTPGTATSLSAYGTVKLFEAPHTGENFLLREMGYKIARKHAQKLRLFVHAALFGVPIALCALTAYIPSIWGAVVMVFVFVLSGIGILVERWLFLAEAKHVVTLYYGAESA
jgi:sulfite dehydrogenase (quinone) subunit SoeC